MASTGTAPELAMCSEVVLAVATGAAPAWPRTKEEQPGATKLDAFPFLRTIRPGRTARIFHDHACSSDRRCRSPRARNDDGDPS